MSSDQQSCQRAGPAAKTARRHWIQLSDLNWPVVCLIYTVMGALSALRIHSEGLATGSSRSILYPIIWELSGYYAALTLTPAFVFVFGRLPIRRNTWKWTIPLLLLISVTLGVVHTYEMLWSRTAIYKILDLGTYNYGTMGYRILMEYSNQFLHFWLFYTAMRWLTHRRESREFEQRAAALELKTSELQRQLAQTQLQALRSQLNPHFLFNTLNMVSSVMYENLDRADHMIAALSRMLRMSLQENVDACVPLRREIEFVQCAIELIQARFGDRVCFDLHCPPECLDLMIPNMLLHTLLENAVKHHDLQRESTMRIQARIQRGDNSLTLTVTDNGPGIPDLNKAMGKGVGLKNTVQRLAALYGDRHRIEFKNRPEGGLIVSVTIPLDHVAPGANNRPVTP